MFLQKKIKFIKKYKWETLTWIAVLLACFWQVRELFSADIPSGWDTAGHLFMVQQMAEFMMDGRISGYTQAWFGGMPLFVLYSPFFYIVVGLLSILLKFVMPLEAVFNMVLLLGVPFFLAALCFVAHAWFGKKKVIPTLLLGFLFLTSSKIHGHIGVGISGMLYTGLVASYFGICLYLWNLGFLKQFENTEKRKYLILFTLGLTALWLTHILSSIFFLATFAWYFLCHRPKVWKHLLAAFGISLLLASFWIIPFVHYLPFAVTQKLINLFGNEQAFMTIFHNLTLPNLFFLGETPAKDFPLLSLIFLFFCILGGKQAVKTKQYFWLGIALGGILFLQTPALYDQLDITLHYYRFISFVFLGAIFLALQGMQVPEFKRFTKKYTLATVVLVVVCFSFIATPWNYDFKSSFHHKNVDFSFSTVMKDTPGAKDADAMVEHVCSIDLGDQTVLFLDYGHSELIRYGTPRYFQLILPYTCDVPIYAGFLKESSWVSLHYKFPTRKRLFRYINEHKNSPPNLLEGTASDLKKDGAGWIITSNVRQREVLEEKPEVVRLDKVFGELALFEILGEKGTPAKAQSTKPFLFLGEDKEFLKFALYTPLPTRDDIVWTADDLEDLSSEQKSLFSGVIVGSTWKSKESIHTLYPDIPKIFLEREGQVCRSETSMCVSVEKRDSKEIRDLTNFLQKIRKSIESEVGEYLLEDGVVEVSGKGVVRLLASYPVRYKKSTTPVFMNALGKMVFLLEGYKETVELH